MKKLYYLFAALVSFTSCHTSKDFLTRSNEEKALRDAVKYLDKHPGDQDAMQAITVLYPKLQESFSSRINNYGSITDLSRWDKLAGAYNSLQSMHEVISGSLSASSLVHTQNYQPIQDSINRAAAEDYYSHAKQSLDNGGKEQARLAYQYFKRSSKWVNGYRDADALAEKAFQLGIVDVVINPIQDNSWYGNSGWNNGFNYSNKYFQERLIRELGGTYARRYPARFYTDWDARRLNVNPSWMIDLTLSRLDIPRPSISQSVHNASKSIEAGRDTSGRPIYKSVFATVTIHRQFFTAEGQMDINISDVETRKQIGWNSYREYVKWQDEYATYTGDYRALDYKDIELVNRNSNFRDPDRDAIIRDLYEKFYPQIKSRVETAVRW